MVGSFNKEMAIEEIRENIATILIVERKKRGLKQKELANMAGVAEKTIYQLENFHGNPTLKTIDRLAKALNLGIEDFLNKERESK